MKDMKSYIIPTLERNSVTITMHTGTNNLKSINPPPRRNFMSDYQSNDIL